MIWIGIEAGELLTGAQQAGRNKENAQYPKSFVRAGHLFKFLNLTSSLY
jgi:hypothetical protein